VNLVAQNPEDALWRDGLIQRFEYTFELARATLTRFLHENSNSLQTGDQPDYQEIIRSANQDGLLLGSWPEWRGYRDARNETSHTYKSAEARDGGRAGPGISEGSRIPSRDYGGTAEAQECKFILNRNISESCRRYCSATFQTAQYGLLVPAQQECGSSHSLTSTWPWKKCSPSHSEASCAMSSANACCP